MATRVDIFTLIIGGGPVGLALAIDLGLRGVPAILVNDGLETARNPKCNYSNARTMEHFRRLGIAAEVRQSGLGVDLPRTVSFRTRFVGHELGRIELSFLKGEEWPGPEFGHHINQLYLEPILKRHAEATKSVDVRFGQQAVDLAFDHEGATVDIDDVVTGERSTVRARYVVGCDGARSMVRRAIGATLTGEDGTVARNFVSGTMMSYFIKAPKLFEQAKAGPAMMTWIVNLDARGFIFSQNGRDRFIVHYGVPPGEHWQDVDPDEVLAKMLGPGVEYEIISSGLWTGGLALVADHYASERAFIAGDAAHLFTPLGGFGMNTGIGDAMNLGWKLAGVYYGWGGAGLLHSYGVERQPIGVRNSSIGVHCAKRKDKWQIPPDINEDSDEAERRRREFGAYIAEDDRDEYVTMGMQLGERYASDIIVPPAHPTTDDPWDVYIPTSEAGARAPHFVLGDGRSIYDAFGLDFGLIAFSGADPTAVEEAASARGLPLRTVKVAAKDPQYRHSLILVRPDGHIAWSADVAPENSLALVDKVRGANA